MLAAIAALSMVPAVYSFPADSARLFDVKVSFDGYLPLLGSETGSAEVQMALEVAGLAPDDKGRPRASTDLKDITITFNGAVLPFGIESVKTYFPKTTASLDPLGKVLETDAPDVQLPVRLPGLDIKKFPETTWLPLEFPKEGIEEGKAFTFKRDFAAGPMEFTVTPKKIADGVAEMDFTATQSFEVFENEAGEIVATEADAFAKVKTAFKAIGNANFDLEKGVLKTMHIDAEAVSEVAELKSGAKRERRLKTKLDVKLREKP